MGHDLVPPRQRRNAKSMRRVMTDAELKLWNELRAHRLMGLGFRRQVPIGRYIVDFACPSHRVIVEVDGIQHAEAENAAKDTDRTTYLEAAAGPCSASGTATSSPISTPSAATSSSPPGSWPRTQGFKRSTSKC